MDNWDLYNCKLSDMQFYNGTSQIFLPFVHDAVNARATRFGNQLFPVSGRCVAVTTTEEQFPRRRCPCWKATSARRRSRPKSSRRCSSTATVEGQYNIYVSWLQETRKTTRRVTVANVKVGDAEFPDLGTSDDYVDDEDDLGRPDVEVLHDADVLILPVTARSVEDAIANGGSATIQRRWSKGRIRRAIDSTATSTPPPAKTC
jgi:hypothetical protein